MHICLLSHLSAAMPLLSHPDNSSETHFPELYPSDPFFYSLQSIFRHICQCCWLLIISLPMKRILTPALCQPLSSFLANLYLLPAIITSFFQNICILVAPTQDHFPGSENPLIFVGLVLLYLPPWFSNVHTLPMVCTGLY